MKPRNLEYFGLALSGFPLGYLVASGFPNPFPHLARFVYGVIDVLVTTWLAIVLCLCIGVGLTLVAFGFKQRTTELTLNGGR